MLAVKDVRERVFAADAEDDKSRQPLRVGDHIADVHAFGCQGFANEAAHLFVPDPCQHGRLDAQPRQTGGEVAR